MDHWYVAFSDAQRNCKTKIKEFILAFFHQDNKNYQISLKVGSDATRSKGDQVLVSALVSSDFIPGSLVVGAGWLLFILAGTGIEI